MDEGEVEGKIVKSEYIKRLPIEPQDTKQQHQGVTSKPMSYGSWNISGWEEKNFLSLILFILKIEALILCSIVISFVNII